jgi:hypothetical protein
MRFQFTFFQEFSKGFPGELAFPLHENPFPLCGLEHFGVCDHSPSRAASAFTVSTVFDLYADHTSRKLHFCQRHGTLVTNLEINMFDQFQHCTCQGNRHIQHLGTSTHSTSSLLLWSATRRARARVAVQSQMETSYPMWS